jgi:hypothetical protein
MRRISMKGATPVGSAPLCRTCSNAHIMTGYRESEMMVVCRVTYPDFRVPFVVRDCSGFNDRAKPDYGQMKKLAIHVAPPIRSSRKIGFAETAATVDVECDAEEDFDDD